MPRPDRYPEARIEALPGALAIGLLVLAVLAPALVTLLAGFFD